MTPTAFCTMVIRLFALYAAIQIGQTFPYSLSQAGSFGAFLQLTFMVVFWLALIPGLFWFFAPALGRVAAGALEWPSQMPSFQRKDAVAVGVFLIGLAHLPYAVSTLLGVFSAYVSLPAAVSSSAYKFDGLFYQTAAIAVVQALFSAVCLLKAKAIADWFERASAD